MFQKILVAMDRSPFGEYVFEKALSLAQALKAELMLLHVLSADEVGSPQMPTSSTGIRPFAGMEAAIFEVYQQQWQEFESGGMAFLRSHVQTAQAADVKVEFTQTSGSPGRVICNVAQSWSANLIVMGRRGRSGLSELFLGSVSNYVLHHAPCEVLIVHTPPSS
jgi:nucleotide-binding universal stress UspA family protein